MVADVTEQLGSGVDRHANLDRFSGFADLYDVNRPTAPVGVGLLLASYAAVASPRVVDLGSGTGLSSRWAASWASDVIGVEPNADMRAQAEVRPVANVTYREGTSDDTGLGSASADVVVAVQAMHWMEPVSTLREVARILRPGGVFAVLDADWPPVTGIVEAEMAWQTFHRRVRVFEARAARGEVGARLRAPISDDDPSLVDDDLRDPHRNRVMPGGVESWSKADHLDRIRGSGHFSFVRELVFDQPSGGGADRFVALMRSQGSYQALSRLGLSDDELGATTFEHEVRLAYAGADSSALPELSFSWRVRVGRTPIGHDGSAGTPQR
jgi:SAM-dependent methyltransferase